MILKEAYRGEGVAQIVVISARMGRTADTELVGSNLGLHPERLLHQRENGRLRSQRTIPRSLGKHPKYFASMSCEARLEVMSNDSLDSDPGGAFQSRPSYRSN
jgi:hypothetical protein